MCNLYTALRGISINQPRAQVQATRHARSVVLDPRLIPQAGYEVFQEILHGSNVGVGVTETVTISPVGYSKLVINSSGYRFPASCWEV